MTESTAIAVSERPKLDLQVSNTGSLAPLSVDQYAGISASAFPESAQRVLLEAIDPNDVEIKPDGPLFLPEIKYRRRLFRAFGVGGWALKPVDIKSDGHTVAFKGALYCLGRFVAEHIGEADFIPNNPSYTWATAVESAQSNCLMRCCKDLGIASELWDPVFVREWKAKYAVQVWCQKKGSTDKKRLWRRKDGEPFSFPWEEQAGSPVAPPRKASQPFPQLPAAKSPPDDVPAYDAKTGEVIDPKENTHAEPAGEPIDMGDVHARPSDDDEPANDFVECWRFNKTEKEWISLGLEPKHTAAQMSKYRALAAELNVSDEDRRKAMITDFNKDSSALLSKREMGNHIDRMEKKRSLSAAKSDRQKARGQQALMEIAENFPELRDSHE